MNSTKFYLKLCGYGKNIANICRINDQLKSKIAYLCSSESWGGLEMNHFRNALWMREHGKEVVVFAIKNSPIANAAKKSQLQVVFVSRHRKYYDISAALKLAKLFRTEKITHLFIRDTKDMSIAGLTKTLLKNHLTVAYFMEMQLGINKKDLLHTIRFTQLDFWFCPLNWLKDQVVEKTRFPVQKIHVLPSALDLSALICPVDKQSARNVLNLPHDLTLFGLIGRFDPQKGQLMTLKAFQALKSNSVGLVFLGEKTKNESDAYFHQIENFIKNNDLQDKVFLRSFRKDVSTFYAAIDATVMASKSETFGMVTIESMACGVPVIGSAAGGTLELLKQGNLGYLFSPENPLSLKNAMVKFLENTSLFNAEKLQIEAQQFNYLNITPKIIEICQI